MIDIKIVCRNTIERDYGMFLFEEAMPPILHPVTFKDKSDENCFHLKIGTHTDKDLEIAVNYNDLF